MNASWVAARAGARRGWIELKHTFTTPNDLVTLLIFTGILLGVMLWTRNTTVPGTHFSLGTAMLASMIGMTVGFNGLATLGSILTVEREDGTLLRAKATPNGMTGYLIGKVVTVSGTILISVAATLITGALLFSGLAVGSASTWLQWAGQVFPLYWLGLGTRSALLPANLASVEIGHSWRHLATFGVLTAWAVAGLLVAPILLRRAARRESGSSVAARREKVLRQVAG
jgi:ABC-2 type transport system permease protein